MNESVRREIEALLRQAPRGVLKANALVQYAQGNPGSALYKALCWDDEECGRLFRLQQARRFIRVVVENIAEHDEPVRVYVSLSSDRDNAGGYRRRDRVLGNRNQRMVLCTDALEQVAKVRRMNGFQTLDELEPFFDKIEALVRRTRRELGIEEAVVV